MRKLSRLFLAFGILGFLSLVAPSWALASGTQQLKNFIEVTRSARGSFVQSVSGKSGRKPQQSVGTFAFARPGKFRWSYEKPYVQLLVSDGEKLWSYDPDLNQVAVKRLGKAFGSSPAALLAGESLEKNFILKDAGEAEGLEIVDATPKGEDSSFERVRIGFRDNLPRLMEVRDGFGQVTTLMFHQFESNPALSPGQFRFTPPKGADVVSE